MLSAMSSLDWDSSWSPAFASEVPHGSQLASYLDRSEQSIIKSQLHSFDDQIPSIDESVFDLLDYHVSAEQEEVCPNFDEDLGLHKWEEIPDLEEVLNISSPSSAGSSPARVHIDFSSDDEVPPLEDLEEIVQVEQTSPAISTRSGSVRTSWSSPEYLSSGSESPSNSEIASSPLMFEEVVEEVVYTPCNAVEIVVFSPASAAASECGSASLGSSFSEEASDFLEITAKGSLKRRRTSQISVASSSGISSFDERGSPTYDIDDSPPRKKKGGRKAKYTAEDRKERKKEQNRTAAERYRFKRKLQEEVVGDEEQKLIDENVDLKTDVAKLEAEVSCLKSLMRDMLKAKGIEIPPRIKKAKF